MWFKKLVGFTEENPAQVRANLIVEGTEIQSKINKKKYTCGTLEIPTLKELKHSAPAIAQYSDKMAVAEIVGDVQDLHKETANKNAVFQAASQFNLLEMVGPYVIPEAGIGIYENDYTQGPACSIACGAGTMYRNYFIPLQDQLGQTAHQQIDCLDEIGIALKNEDASKWTMRNGYALATLEGLQAISKQLKNASLSEYEAIKEKLKVGIQWHTEVTISANKQLVSQVYCSALPVSYLQIASAHWESFARLILEATYEATFYAALKNYEQTGSNKLYLTLVGGGAFGNELTWILDAIEQSILTFKNTPLDVRIVSYRYSDLRVKAFVEEMNKSQL